MKLSAQELVVGSGAGGAVTAALLAEAGREVLVAEEGNWVAQGTVEPFSLEQMDLQYRSAGLTAALGRPPIAYVEGSCAGGGTEVNAGLYHRPPAELLAEWGMAADALVPFSEEIERALSIQPLPGPAPLASRKLADGAAALGWSVSEVPRWYRYDGGGAIRQSMTETFLPRAKAAGAEVRCGLRVDRLHVLNGRVTGAAATLDGRHVEIEADHVWLCGGAIGTPALLQRSGVRGVGGTLRLHPTAKAVAVFDEDVEGAADVPVHQVKEFGPDLTLGGSASRPEQVALALVDDWGAGRAIADDPGRAAVYYAAIRPRGRGRVRAVPGLREPVVTFRLTRADRRLLEQGLARLVHLLRAAGASTVHPSAASLMTVHLMSSVPAGDDERLPADASGALRGLAGAHVNDASQLPGATGVNPQGTLMALALRNVTRYLETRA